jgi:DNA polymerase V
VLQCPYAFAKAKLIVREMTELLVLDLVDKELVTDQIVLTIGYDVENLRDPDRRSQYRGDVTTDQYGRQIPKHAHGTANLGRHTSSTKQIMAAVTELFDRIVSPDLLVRRVNVTANHVMAESAVQQAEPMEQLDLFTDTSARAAEAADRRKERRMQETMLSIRKKFGKNAILKGMNLEEGATTMERNRQIGGHKA